MAVYKNSRFGTAQIYRVPNSLNVQIDNRKFLELENFENWEIVVYEDKDRLDLLAFNYYKNAQLWWVIADVNHIAFPLEIAIGTRIFIPDFFEVRLLLESLGVT